MRILWLYEQVMSYTEGVMRALYESYGVKQSIVCTNPTAQVRQLGTENFTEAVYEQAAMVAHGLPKEWQGQAFDLIIVSGWRLQQYWQWAMTLSHANTVRVLAFDTQWGSLPPYKRLLMPLWGWRARRYFHRAWIPGPQQGRLAQAMGFSKKAIIEGLYTANTYLFNNPCYQAQSKVLLYVGRFEAVKGLELLKQVWLSLPQHDWTLHLVGKGPLAFKCDESQRIKVYPFSEGQSLRAHFAHASAFILPSLQEPFGVVVHEAACMGLPLMLSDACGAGALYLKHGENGLEFNAGDADALRATLLQLMAYSENQLEAMSHRSVELAGQNSSVLSAHKLMKGIKS
jgi:glycosyltransferase involved in cell wall biosynthesis